MGEDTALCLHRGVIKPEWIDHNDHMNVAYYVLVFDLGTDALLDYLGIDGDYRRQSGNSTYVLESHITYEREMKAGDAYRVTTQLLDMDAKRLHYFEQLFHEADDTLAATTEIMLIHMDMRSVRAAPMPAGIQANAAALMEAHGGLPRPPQAGRVIGIGAGRPS